MVKLVPTRNQVNQLCEPEGLEMARQLKLHRAIESYYSQFIGPK